MSEERIKLENELSAEQSEGQEPLSPEQLDEIAGGVAEEAPKHRG